jgi:hypothetical protein
LVTDYAEEVEKLEEQLGEKDRRIHELEAVNLVLEDRLKREGGK